MFDTAYRKRLDEDLPHWREKGWVTAEGATAILASLDESRKPGFGLAAVVAVLGTLLIGFGIFAFIGANWDYMPRLFRFGLLIALLGVTYGAAALLQKRDLPRFADAAVLLGCLIFGAAIALVGQTYHMAGEFSDAVMLWLIGVGVAAVLTRSVSAIVAALAGAAYWTWLTTVEVNVVPHWGSLIAVLALGACAVRLDSRPARMVAILALGFWIATTTLWLGERLHLSPAASLGFLAGIGLALWATGILLATVSRPYVQRFGQDLQTPALAGFLAAIAAIQVVLDYLSRDGSQLWIAPAVAALVTAVLLAGFALQRGALRPIDAIAVAVLGAAALVLALWSPDDDFAGRLAAGSIVVLAALWWVSLGHAGHIVGSKIGLFAFGTEVLYLYSVTLGSLIDTALAFFGGGALFIALAVLLFRLDKRLAARQEAA